MCCECWFLSFTAPKPLNVKGRFLKTPCTTMEINYLCHSGLTLMDWLIYLYYLNIYLTSNIETSNQFELNTSDSEILSWICKIPLLILIFYVLSISWLNITENTTTKTTAILNCLPKQNQYLFKTVAKGYIEYLFS